MKTKIIAVAVLVFGLLGNSTVTTAQTVPSNMALIPAGTFTMGDTLNNSNGVDTPSHPVYVSAFYMDKYEITRGLWEDVYSWAISHGYEINRQRTDKISTHPIEVAWYDAIKWCNARSEKESIVPAYYTSSARDTIIRKGAFNPYNDSVKWTTGYRLPTEAEWEKAARGGASNQRFPWGNTISHNQANYYSVSAWIFDISVTREFHPAFNDGIIPFTSPVGSFPPNGYGLYDMAGNVFEWCWDSYYDYSGDMQTDPRGPEPNAYRMLRSGGWGNGANYCEVTMRSANKVLMENAYGFRTVLPAITPDWRTVIETQPVQPTYGKVPEKEAGKTNVIVLTHGWNPDVKWLDDMASAIKTYLTVNGLTNWQVMEYKWVEKAQLPFNFGLGPELTLRIAEGEGNSLGLLLTKNNWGKIQFIGHSAGSALTQAASATIKSHSPSTIIHLTFLDAFVGATYGGKSKYGKGADWAEQYFSRDPETVLTDKLLDHAYNVDVTWLDPNQETVQVVSSALQGNASQTCYQIVSSHGWPYQFYMNTIPPSSVFNSKGFGFPLSAEGGASLNLLTNQYKIGASQVLGTGGLSCTSNPSGTSLRLEPVLDWSQLPYASVIMNSPEHVIIRGIDFTLQTASPAWMSVIVPVTNKVNLVSFQTRYQSIGAEGLLSVYWKTNIIGSIDERVVLPGLQSYTFPIPETVAGDTGELGFRLDSFSLVQSIVNVTNVSLGFAGVKDPFSLSFTGVKQGGLPVLQLNGPSGFNYKLETSTNLLDWTTVAVLVNTIGTVRFVDTNNATARFYRAVAP